MTGAKRRPRARSSSGQLSRDEIEAALDMLAVALDVTGERKLLQAFEYFERKLDALDGDDAVMKRATKRALSIGEPVRLAVVEPETAGATYGRGVCVLRWWWR